MKASARLGTGDDWTRDRDEDWRRTTVYLTGISGIAVLLVAGDGHLCGELLGGGRNACAAGELRLADDDWDAGVAADADRLVDRNAAEERHVHLGRQRLAAALAEDVALVAAGRADEVAHVLDQAERRNVQFLIHPDGAPRVGQRHRLRRRDETGARDRARSGSG